MPLRLFLTFFWFFIMVNISWQICHLCLLFCEMLVLAAYYLAFSNEFVGVCLVTFVFAITELWEFFRYSGYLTTYMMFKYFLHSIGCLFTFLCPLVHFFFFFWCVFLPCAACRILVPQPGIKPVPPALEVRSLNYWVAREVFLANFWAFKIYFQ